MMLNLSTLLAFQGFPRDLGAFVPLLGMVLIFYFIVWVPMRRRQKAFQTMVEALKKGDKVVTTGGLYGEVVSVDSNTVILKIADTVKVKVAKSAIGSLEGQEGDKGDNR